jgi:hypothetical protein
MPLTKQELLDFPLSEIFLSKRPERCLYYDGIKCLRDFHNIKEISTIKELISYIQRIPNFGTKSFNEFKSFLADYDLSLSDLVRPIDLPIPKKFQSTKWLHFKDSYIKVDSIVAVTTYSSRYSEADRELHYGIYIQNSCMSWSKEFDSMKLRDDELENIFFIVGIK